MTILILKSIEKHLVVAKRDKKEKKKMKEQLSLKNGAVKGKAITR